jgi:hypothetical protein
MPLLKIVIMSEPNSIGKEDGDAKRVTRGEGEESVSAEGRGACVESGFGAQNLGKSDPCYEAKIRFLDESRMSLRGRADYVFSRRRLLGALTGSAPFE